jgi:hypothetical protein
MPKVSLEELLKKQDQREAKLAEDRARLTVRVRKAVTRRNIGQGQLAEEADLLPLIQDRHWLQLTAETRRAVVLYIRAGIQNPKTIHSWAKAWRVDQTGDVEELEIPDPLPTAAE